MAAQTGDSNKRNGEYLQSVSFTDANTGTAVGDSGTILRTRWRCDVTSQSSGTDQQSLRRALTDANTGTAVGRI